jgi:hypothetical protein
MTTLVTTRSGAFARRPWRRTGFEHFFAQCRGGIQDARGIAARYDELSRLTPGELAQYGLTRNDITRVALTGRVK